VNASQKEAESMRKVTEILKDIQAQGNKLDVRSTLLNHPFQCLNAFVLVFSESD